jgi:hypothetical protein
VAKSCVISMLVSNRVAKRGMVAKGFDRYATPVHVPQAVKHGQGQSGNIEIAR